MTQESLPAASPYQLFGHDEPLIVTGGHSHAAAMIRAMHETPFDPMTHRVAVAYTTDWSAPNADDYFDYLVEVSAGRSVAFSFSGNEHNRRFLLQRKPFRVWDPQARAELGPEHGDWIPRTMFRDLWTGSFELLHTVVRRLAEKSTVYVLATPPPKSDALCREALASEPYFLQQATDLGIDAATVQVTPAVTRVALWRILDDLLREKAEAEGAVFVPVPDGVQDGDGVLLPEFAFSDVTHANGRYGALAWEQLIAHHSMEMTR